MCGITGFVDFSKHSDRTILESMTGTLEHRGPDSYGTRLWQDGSAMVGFGHRRLSVIDLSPAAAQPMTFGDGEAWITYNGEVYNFQEIRAELSDSGERFSSASDTEVVLKAFRRWGERAVDRFVGMFVFALYDRRSAELWFFRDRAGVKPLYVYDDGQLLLFSSELRAFHRHPAFKAEIDREAVALFLQCGYIPGPHTIFRRCRKLEPGERLRVGLRDRAREYRTYWRVVDAYNAPQLDLDETEAIETTEQILRSACEYRMIADVPVGLFLSGGYDSTAVAALLQTERTDKIRTFTIGFADRQYDEAPYARQVAKHLGTEHSELYCTEAEALAIVPELPAIYDEPFADSSAVPTTLVSRMARKQVTVALSADAGDEVFAGYDKYLTVLKLRSWLKSHPLMARSLKNGILSRIDPDRVPLVGRFYNAGTRLRKVAAIARTPSVVASMQEASRIFTEEETARFLADGYGKAPGTAFDKEHELLDSVDALSRMMAIDYRTYMVDDILTKVDRATMSVSLEGREPLLDHRIVEHVARLPSGLKLHSGVLKYLLKQVVHRYVPVSIMDRPKKGFSVPLGRWFRGALKDLSAHYLDEARLRAHGLFNTDEVRRLHRVVNEGGRENPRKLWSLLMFQMWYERWIERGR